MAEAKVIRKMRTSIPLVLMAFLANGLLLAACGSEVAGPAGDRSALGGGGSGADSPGIPGDPADLAKDGVRIIGMSSDRSTADAPSSVTAAFEVTNREAEPFTYTVTFDLLSESGGVQMNTNRTVASVRPGGTVRSTVRLDGRTVMGGQGRVRIAKVRRVPSDEFPAESGPCPASGVRVTADAGDAAMGLRVVGLRLRNCGKRTYHLNGYPLLKLLDEDRKPVSGIRVLRGSGSIATVAGFDAPPRPVTLKPGEAASAGLVWRNTTGGGIAANVPYVQVRTKSGAGAVTVTPELDLGTTGKLGVSPWKKASSTETPAH
ncbi:DUF4232 domain-containing protein [Streptomyces sp. NPDC047117]|uniref:DUF4232 domain-containing protein n=1 Tax=Streptomyces sp. NPDC047117 TaxID=3155379 RepID=UPI0033CD9E6B